MSVLDPSHYSWNIYALPNFVTSLILLAFGTFILTRKIKALTSWAYFFECFVLSIWLTGFGIAYLSQSGEVADYWFKWMWIGVWNISFGNYLFTTSFLKIAKERKVMLALAGIFSTSMVLGTVRPDFYESLISGHYQYFWGFYPRAGPFLPYAFIVFMFFQYACLYELWLSYRRSASDEYRLHLRWLFAAYLTAFIAHFDFLACFGWSYYPFGYAPVVIWISLLGFAIVRYRLMEIQTVIHKTLLWAALSSLVLAPLFGILWLTRSWLETLPTWAVSVFVLGLFYLTTLYYQIIQPKIDHLFQRRKYDLQEVLEQLLDRLALLGDIRDLSRQILRTLVETLYAKHATLLLPDEKTQSFRPMETAGLGLNVQLPADDAFIEWVRQRPVIIEADAMDQEPVDADIMEAAKGFFDRTGSVVCVPLTTGHEFVGLIHLGKKTNLKSYIDLDIRFLDRLRVETAIALSNATLYDRVMRLNAELTGLNAQLEEKVRDRTVELERANRQLSESNQKISEADRMKTKFLANMSHELRNPLNSIIGFSKVLLNGIEGPLTVPQKTDLEAIYKSGLHLLGLISDLLDLSKIEAGKMDLHLEEMDFRDLVNGVLSTAQALSRGKPVELKQEIAVSLPNVWGDGTRLRQVVLNLVSNAIKFTDRGEVEVRVEQRGAYVVISVRDTGFGIAMEDQGKLFEEFRQLDGGRQRGGTGLGLAISKKFVQLHGGEIWVESRVGEGSTFSFSLPIKQESGAPLLDLRKK